jgi:hypothetical protein
MVEYTKKLKIRKTSKTNKRKTNKSNKNKKQSQLKLTIMNNTRDEPCKKNNFTACCPHMPPDDKRRYAATNEKTILKYKGKKYELHTCCLMCSQALNKLAKNVTKFNKEHKPIIKDGYLYLANKYTGFHVQKLKQV